jgi:hypothetical protein
MSKSVHEQIRLSVQTKRRGYTTQKYLNSGWRRPICSSLPHIGLKVSSHVRHTWSARTQRSRVQIPLQVQKDNRNFLYCPAQVQALHCIDGPSKISYWMPRKFMVSESSLHCNGPHVLVRDDRGRYIWGNKNCVNVPNLFELQTHNGSNRNKPNYVN